MARKSKRNRDGRVNEPTGRTHEQSGGSDSIPSPARQIPRLATHAQPPYNQDPKTQRVIELARNGEYDDEHVGPTEKPTPAIPKPQVIDDLPKDPVPGTFHQDPGTRAMIDLLQRRTAKRRDGEEPTRSILRVVRRPPPREDEDAPTTPTVATRALVAGIRRPVSEPNEDDLAIMAELDEKFGPRVEYGDTDIDTEEEDEVVNL